MNVLVSLVRGLTHWGRVMHICIGKLTIIGSDNGLSVTWMAPSHYLNQGWNIVNWTLGNKLKCSLKRNSKFFIEENTFENVVCEMLSISFRPQCVYSLGTIGHVYTCQWTRSSLVQEMDFCLFSINPLSEPMLTCCQFDPTNKLQ